MNVWDIISLLPQILPLLPRIEKAVDTIKRLENDKDMQDALTVLKQVSHILEQLPKRS